MFFFETEAQAANFAKKRDNYVVKQVSHLGETRWAVQVVDF